MKKDITNQKFGRLTAKEVVRAAPGKGNIWKCECDAAGRKKFLSLIYLMGMLGAAAV